MTVSILKVLGLVEVKKEGRGNKKREGWRERWKVSRVGGGGKVS